MRADEFSPSSSIAAAAAAWAKLVVPREIGVSARTRRPEAMARWKISVTSLPGALLFDREIERPAQLAENLELARHHRLEPRRRR